MMLWIAFDACCKRGAKMTSQIFTSYIYLGFFLYSYLMENLLQAFCALILVCHLWLLASKHSTTTMPSCKGFQIYRIDTINNIEVYKHHILVQFEDFLWSRSILILFSCMITTLSYNFIASSYWLGYWHYFRKLDIGYPWFFSWFCYPISISINLFFIFYFDQV